MFRFKDEHDEQKPELVIIPMVDVMLFLLAFFVLIAGSIIPGLAIKTTPPETSQKTTFTPARKVVTVVVKSDGAILFRGKRVSIGELKGELRKIKAENPLISLAVNADKNASVQSLVDVLDVARDVGINSLGLVAKERNERKR